MSCPRRQLLTTTGAAVGLAFAGCLSAPAERASANDDLSGIGAFFPLEDWGNQIGGEVLSLETPVATGELGHGWHPDANLVADIAQHDVFVYLGTPEFRWAVDIARELSNEDYDVQLIDAMTAIPRSELLPFTGTDPHDRGANSDDEDDHVAGGELADATDHDPTAHENGADTADAVGASHDPHVWVDPVFAQSMVGHIAASFEAFAPEYGETFRRNAQAYLDRLADVDRQFEELVTSAELDVAVYVAHDTYQYVEHRYGFELQTPVGVAPDASVSIQDLAALRRTILDHGIDTILFDPFDAPDPSKGVPQAVEVLLAETPAERAAPLTALEGNTPEWHAAGYGWVEQMDAINLPALRDALRAS